MIYLLSLQDTPAVQEVNKDGKNVTPKFVDIDTLLKNTDKSDCYDDDLVSYQFKFHHS